MADYAELIARLKPAWVIDEPAGEAVRLLRLGGYGQVADALNRFIVENNALKADSAAAISSLVEERGKLAEALTPSGGTKAAYIGEFTIAVERSVNEDEEADDEGDSDPYDHISVPWTTIKQIMAAIRSRALGEKTV